MSNICVPHHDYTANTLTALLCAGITISYLPQHRRIIEARSSEGFSPWFLLLGSTSSASGVVNIVVMQWNLVKCCRVLTAGQCLESTAGIFQLALQWFMFTLILVLYMMYYPPHLKYAQLNMDGHEGHISQQAKKRVKSAEWQLSIILSWAVLVHLLFITFVTFVLLSTNPATDGVHRARQLSLWATFLGVSSALVAGLQYLPQLVHTYRLKLVGALSIKMMLMQSPGAIAMVLSIALRPDTNWTTWLPYAVAGVLQGTLLVMCLFWRTRQRRLGIDDFGNLLEPQDGSLPAPLVDDLDAPVDVMRGPDEGFPVRQAVEVAVEDDVRAPEMSGEGAGEQTPLLKKNGQEGNLSGIKRWFGR
ncbi:hypothetical protein OBBRIDRAFT_792914 [Obba rivulosa]|uniref:Uncharacterized protein n=1 Tax=Obba rivulosa TaxID=1052685 RepID=A0A8E2DKT6_9APHY|nr:hypothetical protein OBBRIDRAFT_792914 [Obba rivulosa]